MKTKRKPETPYRRVPACANFHKHNPETLSRWFPVRLEPASASLNIISDWRLLVHSSNRTPGTLSDVHRERQVPQSTVTNRNRLNFSHRANDRGRDTSKDEIARPPRRPCSCPKPRQGSLCPSRGSSDVEKLRQETVAPLKVNALVPDERALNARSVHDQLQAPTPLRQAKDREKVKLWCSLSCQKRRNNN